MGLLRDGTSRTEATYLESLANMCARSKIFIEKNGSALNKHEARHSNSLIKVRLSEDMDQMAFDKAKDIIDAGEKAAEEMIPALKTEMQEEGLLI